VPELSCFPLQHPEPWGLVLLEPWRRVARWWAQRGRKSRNIVTRWGSTVVSMTPIGQQAGPPPPLGGPGGGGWGPPQKPKSPRPPPPLPPPFWPPKARQASRGIAGWPPAQEAERWGWAPHRTSCAALPGRFPARKLQFCAIGGPGPRSVAAGLVADFRCWPVWTWKPVGHQGLDHRAAPVPTVAPLFPPKAMDHQFGLVAGASPPNQEWSCGVGLRRCGFACHRRRPGDVHRVAVPPGDHRRKAFFVAAPSRWRALSPRFSRELFGPLHRWGVTSHRRWRSRRRDGPLPRCHRPRPRPGRIEEVIVSNGGPPSLSVAPASRRDPPARPSALLLIRARSGGAAESQPPGGLNRFFGPSCRLRPVKELLLSSRPMQGEADAGRNYRDGIATGRQSRKTWR